MMEIYDEGVQKAQQEINEELDRGEKSVYRIGLRLLDVKHYFNNSNQKLHAWRDAVFGDRLEQRTANHYMHVAELFASNRPKNIPPTGLYHLAAPCNKKFYKKALEKLTGDVYHTVKEVDDAIEAARVEAGCAVKPRKRAKQKTKVALEEIIARVDTMTEDEGHQVFLQMVVHFDSGVIAHWVDQLDEAA